MIEINREGAAADGTGIFRNPVYPGYFADPFVFRHEDTYYAVGTGPTGDGRELPIMRSVDLIRWEFLGGALVRPVLSGHCYWAPEVAREADVFYLYYSVGLTQERHQLRVATSDRPDGPYEDVGAPILDSDAIPFAIDPSPFRDADGQWFLFFARDFLDVEDGARPGTGLVMAPLVDMVRITETPTTVVRGRHEWQRFESGRSIYGGVYDWHTLEGPCVATHEGRLYCLYSGGNWQNGTYGIDFVSADSVLGPWQDTNAGIGPRVLRTQPGSLIGPGHNSIVRTCADVDYLAYHAWDRSMTARRLCLDRLEWTEDGPRGVGPTSTDQRMELGT